MWYVLNYAGRGDLWVYPIPTKERAEVLAHCMRGFWRCKVAGVVGPVPLNDHGQPPREVWEGLAKPTDFVTVANQGYNAGTADKPSEAERFYCSDRAKNWRPGLPRCA